MSNHINHPGSILLEQLDTSMANLQWQYDEAEREALEIYSRLLIDELLAYSHTTDVAKALNSVFNSSNPMTTSSPLAEHLPYYQQISTRASRSDGKRFIQAFNRELALRGLNLVITKPHHRWFTITTQKVA